MGLSDGGTSDTRTRRTEYFINKGSINELSVEEVYKLSVLKG